MKNGKLRVTEDGTHLWYCPACKTWHGGNVNLNNYGPNWNFDNNYNNPTFSPSFLVRSGHHIAGSSSDDCWCKYNKDHPDDQAPFKCGICHTFVRDGKIEYLSDCTHEFAGKIINMFVPESEVE